MDPPSRRDALALLYERHYRELVRLAFALTSDWDLAEELAQEAFVRVWRCWGNIRDQQSAPAYLRTTVVNLSRRSLRRRLQERRAWRGADDPVTADPGVYRIDPRRGRVTSFIGLQPTPTGITVAYGRVWVSEPKPGPGTVVRIDPRTNRVSGPPIRVGPAPARPVPGAGALWVTNGSGNGSVSRIDRLPAW